MAAHGYLCSMVPMCHTGPSAQGMFGSQQPLLQPMLICDVSLLRHSHVKFSFPVGRVLLIGALKGLFLEFVASRNACEGHDP